MNILENIRVALRALAANKLRSMLTMLGIIIGVGAVVALMAIGNGATASITSEVQGIGANLITVMAGRFERGGGPQAAPAPLYYSDYERLARSLEDVDYVVPVFQASATVTRDTETINVNVTATTPGYVPTRSYELAVGRALRDGDGSTTARVAVLGSQTATDLFGPLNPLGRTIKIGGLPFEVVGVLKSKGSSGFSNEDETVLVPLETGYDKLFGASAMSGGKRVISAVFISAASPDVVNDVMADATRHLRQSHRLRPSEEADFTVLSQSQFLTALATITTTLTVFLGAIAGISLLVGGIGIMNIMLVSVTERTREIGLRKAVGARQGVILFQFLIETLVLSLVGGLLGVGLGWSIAAGVRAANLIQAQVTPDSVALAFFFSAAVGLFFGLYPAYRASRLRPIEALRYE
jgi:putative ABC transport system permease protein